MKLWSIALCAAAVCVVSSQAEAAFVVAKRSSGFCQILDTSLPFRPLISDWKAVSKPQKSFAAALVVKGKLMKKKTCAW